MKNCLLKIPCKKSTTWKSVYILLICSSSYVWVFVFCRWFLESARWLVLTKKSEQAVKNLKTVARINGRRAEGDKINLEVWLYESCVNFSILQVLGMLILLWLCMQMLQESMKKEMACSKGSYSALDLLRTSTMRTITVCLSAVWSVTQSYHFIQYQPAFELYHTCDLWTVTSQVFNQLRLLRPLHGSAEIWGQHLSYPGHLWSSGYTSQNCCYDIHEHVRTKTISVRSSCTGWRNDTH